jgi:prefoldin subunit 5
MRRRPPHENTGDSTRSTMTETHERRTDIAATVMALAAEAAELQTRVTELRQELVDVDDCMAAVSTALRRLSPR